MRKTLRMKNCNMNYHPATRRRYDIVTTSLCASYVSLQVCLKRNTQWRLGRTMSRRLSGTSLWYLIGTSQDYVRTSPIRVQCLQQVSNETPNHVSVVRVCDVPLVRFYEISCNSEIEHPITSLRFVSTTSQSYFVATLCYWVSTTLSNYFVTSSIYKVSPSHLCIKWNTKIF